MNFTPTSKSELESMILSWSSDSATVASNYGDISTWDT